MKLDKEYFKNYLQKQIELLQYLNPSDLTPIVLVLYEAFTKGRNVFICGNGGSHMNAMHIAQDMMKGVRGKTAFMPKFIALGSNPSSVMAIANDFHYDYVFAFELESLGNPGDTLIGLSVSGNSSNVVDAIDTANKMDMFTIALTGNNGKNPIAREAKHSVSFDSEHFGRVEDLMMTFFHMLAYYFMEVDFEDGK